MQYIVKAPTTIGATINLPASKSICNRALAIHAISGGRIMPDNLSDCDDTTAMLKAVSQWGDTIDIGAAGTAMRFLTALLCLREGEEHVITGTQRMCHRPIGPLVAALRQLGADIEYVGEEGFPPLRIRGGRLSGGRLEVPGNISSQYISALLLIGPAMSNGLELHLTGKIISRPYIDLTLHVMHEFKCAIDWTDVDTITVKPQTYSDMPYKIENDWTAASYWYEMLALCPHMEQQVTLPGLYDGSRQGDSAVRYLFRLLGVKTEFLRDDADTMVLTHHTQPVHRMEYDLVNQPDLAQTLVVTCCALGIHFHFTGLATLKIKETDRIEALKTELRKLGYVLEDRNDGELLWDGTTCEADPQPVIDTYEDHRMAMAFAPVALVRGELRINNPEVVSKSYPRYWDDLRHAGFIITETNQ